MATRIDAAPAEAAHSHYERRDAVTLTAGRLDATFVPALGMVGVSLRHRGEELLDRQRGLAAYGARGAVMGIPLLHPWANRLDARRVACDGREIRLPAGPPVVHCDEHGLPIHGLLAASPHWERVAIASSDGVAQLAARLDFAAHPELIAAFPFPHELELAVALQRDALTVRTTVRATGDVPVPVSFGFHPYLRLPGASRTQWLVKLPARQRLALDARGIPTGAAVAEPAETAPLGARAFDDGFAGLPDGTAFSVAGGGRTVTVTLERGYPCGQVFSPAGRDFICFEPMTAPTNALRTGAGLRRVAPGHEFTAVFSIGVADRA